MAGVEEFSLLIGDIYDAALEPTLWRGVLAKAALFVGGVSAALYAKDATAKSGNLFYEDGWLDPRYTELYFSKYVKFDPSTTGHYFAEIGEPMATGDILPYDEFLETRFYKEWAKPQQLVDHLTAVLDKSLTSVALFGVFRHEREGVADQPMRSRMRLIAPHIRRAVLVNRVIELTTAQSQCLADMLDGLRAGLFLVDPEGRIVHANVAGHAILGEADYLKVVGGKLTANEPQTNAALREIFAASHCGDQAVGLGGIAVPLIGRDGRRHVAHVLPLNAGARRETGHRYAAAAALFVHEAAMHAPSPPEAIANAFCLTPTELRVLLAVVEIGGAPETAEALGVSHETVKTHLGRLYEKTGVRRQADLVRLVAGFANPVVG